MQRAVMDGRAVTAAQQALDVVKADLKALNADVTVSQEEYDEVVAIKPMFLNAGISNNPDDTTILPAGRG